MQTVLTIAGFDPSSGAGITADLMTFAAHGLFGLSCITSLTVQSTKGVKATRAIDPELLSETLEYLTEDLSPAGIKVGMLGTAANVASVAEFLAKIRRRNPEVAVVLDPVIRSSSGRELLDKEGVELLRSELLKQIDWITPNFEELSILTEYLIDSKENVSKSARILSEINMGGTGELINVFATGGHEVPPDDFLLVKNEGGTWLRGEHVESRSTHGTGCALSSALLCRLVLGDKPHAAALAAKQYVTEAIRTATPLGHGHGPLNHLWPLQVRR